MVYLLSRIAGQEQQDRYLRQLTDSGQQSADAVVRAESDLLAIERLIANTQGVLDGVQQADSEALRAVVLPLVVNAGVDVVSIVDAQGSSLLSVRRAPGGSPGEYSTQRGEAFFSSLALRAATVGRLGGQRHRGQADRRPCGSPRRSRSVRVLRRWTGARHRREVYGAVLVGPLPAGPRAAAGRTRPAPASRSTTSSTAGCWRPPLSRRIPRRSACRST